MSETTLYVDPESLKAALAEIQGTGKKVASTGVCVKTSVTQAIQLL